MNQPVILKHWNFEGIVPFIRNFDLEQDFLNAYGLEIDHYKCEPEELLVIEEMLMAMQSDLPTDTHYEFKDPQPDSFDLYKVRRERSNPLYNLLWIPMKKLMLWGATA
ncbi:MAG: hypothetical protein KKA84_11945 [Bacteroidetes bacterium]|nr:hypothetical protein [Bacteroidota bacterium]